MSVHSNQHHCESQAACFLSSAHRVLHLPLEHNRQGQTRSSLGATTVKEIISHNYLGRQNITQAFFFYFSYFNTEPYYMEVLCFSLTRFFIQICPSFQLKCKLHARFQRHGMGNLSLTPNHPFCYHVCFFSPRKIS